MRRRRNVKRWLGLVLGGLVLVLAGLVGSVPFWGPAALGMVVRWSGMEWEAAGLEREGWSGWRWERLRVAGEWGSAELTGVRVPQVGPLVGWWVLGGDPVEVRLKRAGIQLAESPAESPADGTPSLPAPAVAGEWLRRGGDWLELMPRVEIEALQVRSAAEAVLVGLRGLRIGADSVRWGMEQPGIVAGLEGGLFRQNGSDWKWEARLPRAGLEGEGKLRSGGNGLSGEAVIRSSGTPLNVEWHYETEGRQLALRAEEWAVPQALFPSQWPRLEELVMTLDGGWDADGYRLAGQLRGEGEPVWGQRVRAEVDLGGRGEQLRLRKLKVRSGWLAVDLSHAVAFDWGSMRADTAAELTVEADLDRQELWPLRGRLTGQARIAEPGPGPMEVDFSMGGESIRWRDLPAASVEMEGRFHDRKVEAKRLQVSWGGESELELRGGVSLPDRQVKGKGTARLGGALRSLLPEALRQVEQITIDAAVEGDWAEPQHSGSAVIRKLDLPRLKPLDFTLDWAGTGWKKSTATVGARLGDRDVAELKGAFEGGSQAAAAEVTIAGGWLDLLEEADPLRLQAPFRIHWPGEGTAAGLPQMSPLRLSNGAGSSLEAVVRTGEAENTQELQLRVRETGSKWLRDVLAEPLPEVTVSRLDLSVARGPLGWLSGRFRVRASSGFYGENRIQLEGRGLADEEGMQLEALSLKRAGQQLVEGRIDLPMRWRMRQFPDGPVQGEWREGVPMGGSLQVRLPEEGLKDAESLPFAAALAGLTGTVELGGSVESPQARLALELPQTRGWGAWGTVLEEHPLKDLAVSADWNRERLQVQALRGRWAGSELSFSGEVPHAVLWKTVRAEEPDLERVVAALTGKLHMEAVQMENLAGILPPMVRPAGTVEAEVTVAPELQLNGRVRASGLGLRSTLYTAPVEEMELEAQARGQSLKIVSGSARMGSGELQVSGAVDWGGAAGMRYGLRLQGERLPLARTPEVLVRSDLDLELVKESEAPAKVSGTVALRDSVVLVEMNPLAARTRGGPAQQPPYFAVEAAPYRDWELGIAITGEEAVQVRGPYVETVLSVRAQLEGQLGDPRLLGTVRTAEGALVFPATRLRLGRGQVFIKRDQPHRLQLDLRAHGQTASYVISLEVGGTAAEPRMQLTSTPELEQAQILRLLTTGSLQGGGLGSLGLYLGRGLVGPGGGGGWLERFSVEVGREVSESGRDTIDLYYQFTDDLYLHGQYDEYDEQNLDFVWEVYEK